MRKKGDVSEVKDTSDVKSEDLNPDFEGNRDVIENKGSKIGSKKRVKDRSNEEVMEEKLEKDIDIKGGEGEGSVKSHSHAHAGEECEKSESGAGSSKKRSSKKSRDLKEELLEGMSEKEIKELLVAKEALEETKKILEEKEILLREYEELLKRKQADFENYRKRVQREIEENKKYANVEIILDIINVLDDFERAIDSAKSSRDFDALLEGIVMIERQLRGILEKKYGVKRIEAVGKEFDPTMHDAIMMEESDEYEEDTVIEDFQKGYMMHDRIIRPSKVKVAKAVSSKRPGENGNGEYADEGGNIENIGKEEEENTSEKGE